MIDWLIEWLDYFTKGGEDDGVWRTASVSSRTDLDNSLTDDTENVTDEQRPRAGSLADEQRARAGSLADEQRARVSSIATEMLLDL